MFDFAISQNKRWRPSRRDYASWFASCVAHLALLLLLIENPQWLQGGMYNRFRAIPLISSILAPRPSDDDQNWRTVAVLKNSLPMAAPSPATLRKYLYDWAKKDSGGNVPPVRIRWGDEQKAAVNESAAPVPRIRQEPPKPEPLPPANDVGAALSAPQTPPGSSTAASGDTGVGRRGGISLPPPPPDSKPKSEVAGNVTPSTIPSAKSESNAPGSRKTQSGPGTAAGAIENEQKAIRSRESGLFDTKGFPLGEYADLIRVLVEGNWFIPSNLRHSQGETTVIFYIEKDGHYSNAHIVKSSGNNSLDLAALNAVLESNFPPLPKGFPGDHVGAKYVFSYNEPQ
jgi:TonB family protein